MAKFNVDPSERSFTLPKGEYEVIVKSAEEKSPREGEHNYIEVKLGVTEGQYKNKEVIDRLSLSPKARPRLASFCVACGVVPKDHKGELEVDTDDLKGQILIIHGAPEEFKGFSSFRPSRFEMHPNMAKDVEERLNAEGKQGGGDEKPKDEKKTEAGGKSKVSI